LLGYLLIVVALLTLAPFRFAWPETWDISWWGDRRDAPANFLMFLPVGYFYRLVLPRRYPHAVLSALMFGTGMSLSVEFLQLFLPDRLTSVFDVLGNGLGGAAGAVLCNAVRRSLDRRLPSILTLDHPLMNLMYLMLPLMWLACVNIEAIPARAWLLAPLGIMGTLTLAGLWRYRLSRATDIPRSVFALLIVGWFVFGGVTGLTPAPHIVLQCAVIVALLSVALLYVWGPDRQPAGRFEKAILISIWPCYAVYLLMVVLWARVGPFVAFDLAIGYPEYGFERGFAIRIAEQLGALTLFGYLLAESFGRSALPPRSRYRRNLLMCVVCALLLEGLHGFLPGDRASVARWLFGSVAAGFGVQLYAAQLNMVLLLRGRPAGER